MAKLLPRDVYRMCVHGAYIVGSYAKYLVGEDINPGDIDLLVPLQHWQKIALLIPENAKPNKFGGWRFYVNSGGKSVEVDVWPDTVENYLTSCRSKYGSSVYVVDFINNRIFSSFQKELRL